MSTVDPAQIAAFREQARALVADWPPLTKAQRDLIRDSFAIANHSRDRAAAAPSRDQEAA